MSDNKQLDALFADSVPELRFRLQQNPMEVVRFEFQEWKSRNGEEVDKQKEQREHDRHELRMFCNFLVVHSTGLVNRLNRYQKELDQFRQSLNQCRSEEERLEISLRFGKNAEPKSGIKQRKKSAKRSFDSDVVFDQYAKLIGQSQLELIYSLERLGHSLGKSASFLGTVNDFKGFWNRIQLETVVKKVVSEVSEARVQVVALQAVDKTLSMIPAGARENLSGDWLKTFIYRSCLDLQKDIWIQATSLRILSKLSPVDFTKVAKMRLEDQSDSENIFVKREVLDIIGPRFSEQPDWINLLSLSAKDSSPFVRQKMGYAVVQAPSRAAKYWMHQLMIEDAEPKVAAAAIKEGMSTIQRPELQLTFAKLIGQVLKSANDPFLIRVALHIGTHWFQQIVTTTQKESGRANLRLGNPKKSANDLLRDNSEEALESTSRVDLEQIQEILNEDWIPAIEAIRRNHQQTFVRRWAANAAENIWLLNRPKMYLLTEQLKRTYANLKSGHSTKLPKQIFEGVDDKSIGRCLSVLAQNDFDLEIKKSWFGPTLTRGRIFKFRWWRFIYEMRNPSTAKRQAFSHTSGRISNSRLRAPSGILAELSQTNVPGEPLTFAEEGGWRPFIPIVDDFISVLELSWTAAKPVQFFTSEGITTVSAPNQLYKKIRAWIHLTFQFSTYAEMRNWTEKSQGPASEYIQEMGKLGFSVDFQPHSCEAKNGATSELESDQNPGDKTDNCDDTVLRFFPAAGFVGIASAAGLLEQSRQFAEQFSVYFGSLFVNTLAQLFLFVAVMLALFLGRHFWSNWTLRRSRKKVPLAVGGWGTRGKSGTERLKAAIFNAMGFGVFSKSSGCEAMFIHGYPFGTLRELNLYRPYDKATIWEHRNVLMMCASAESDVFLWECMGLTPAYVDVLQRQWTRDDLSTITNTYPDHEDLQGPAGLDVAKVISGYIGRNSSTITTEQNMLPILEESARLMQAEIHSVTWLEAGMLTDDVLERFPYSEHPDNIALVLEMCRQLGCDHDFALKEMADRLVPDLGVLKTYPVASRHARQLEFTNGMSANERFGCLGNWNRLQYDQQDPQSDPTTWICTVVNNRADRVPRSRVFANIIVKDITADRHFLIGNNLKGMLGFIGEAWAEYESGISLWKEDNHGEPDHSAATEVLQEFALKLRQPISTEQIELMLEKSIESIWNCPSSKLAGVPQENESREKLTQFVLQNSTQPEQIRKALLAQNIAEEIANDLNLFLQQQWTALQEYESLKAAIQVATVAEMASLDNDFRRQLKTWFDRKLILVENYDATGNEVVDRICRETPPGHLNRVMGLQNIKGTGLDFAYQWLAWEKVANACDLISDRKKQVRQKGLDSLAENRALGLLGEESVRLAIANLQGSDAADDPKIESQMNLILRQLNEELEKISGSMVSDSSSNSGWYDWVMDKLEEFFDLTDAVHRRKRADQIYRDLERQLISWDRAVIELRQLTKRQKGGWLKTQVLNKQARRLERKNQKRKSKQLGADPAEVEAGKGKCDQLNAPPIATQGGSRQEQARTANTQFENSNGDPGKGEKGKCDHENHLGLETAAHQDGSPNDEGNPPDQAQAADQAQANNPILLDYDVQSTFYAPDDPANPV